VLLPSANINRWIWFQRPTASDQDGKRRSDPKFFFYELNSSRVRSARPSPMSPSLPARSFPGEVDEQPEPPLDFLSDSLTSPNLLGAARSSAPPSPVRIAGSNRWPPPTPLTPSSPARLCRRPPSPKPPPPLRARSPFRHPRTRRPRRGAA
jgi:hypothetical protein